MGVLTVAVVVVVVIVWDACLASGVLHVTKLHYLRVVVLLFAAVVC